jgi:hypothetical protein
MKIAGYQFGHMNIEGHDYTSDLLIFPAHIKSHWWRKNGHRLTVDDLSEVIQAHPKYLIIGTGYYGQLEVPEDTRRELEQAGIEVMSAPTNEAIQTFNRLQKDPGSVVAAMHLTC